jgi:hypothetical protein
MIKLKKIVVSVSQTYKVSETKPRQRKAKTAKRTNVKR